MEYFDYIDYKEYFDYVDKYYYYNHNLDNDKVKLSNDKILKNHYYLLFFHLHYNNRIIQTFFYLII